jgi:FMN-dependent oxidoreductase (nitrilotriacetate monooxygenase family)
MNFGMDRLPPHDQRYEMAEEYVEIVKRLFASWEPGAIVADRKSGVLIDHTKVHTIDFEGKHYRSRGPLNSGPAPQGQPVIAQAGGSDSGKVFAARHADTVVAHPKGIDAMKQYRDDVRSRMVEAGRDPDSCKILFLVAPIVAETQSEARAKADRRAVLAERDIDARLAQFGWSTNLDLSEIDLDTPVGRLELSTNGHQSSLSQFLRKAGNKSLREAIIGHNSNGGTVDLVGDPDSVAAQMQEVMQEVGGDGFLFYLPDVSRRSVATITDGLVPELQQRGLVRRAYAHQHLRDNLLEF